MEERERLLEEIREAYFVLQDERIVQVNGMMASRYGYPKNELVGRPFTEIMAPETRDELLDRYRRRLAGEKVPERYETTARTKEGKRIPVEISAWLTQYRGRPAVAGIITDIVERTENQVEILKGIEEQRRRLAQELHDGAIQDLVVASHQVKDIVDGTYGKLPGQVRERLLELRVFIMEVITDLRGITQELRPAILDDMGLVPALRWVADRVAVGGKLQGEVKIVGETRRLPPDVELALLRIAQEALSNVRRHADASTVMLTLEFRQDSVAMSVTDNGKGFEVTVPPGSLGRAGQMGLVGMYERAELMGASMDLRSEPGRGTSLRVVIPLPRQ